MKEVNSAIRNPYAWPGAYLISIIMDDGSTICPDCAKREIRQVAHDTIKNWSGTGWKAETTAILWEGGNTCDHCNCNLDAYPIEETA